MREEILYLYDNARKKGLKEHNSHKFSGKNPYLPALDTMIGKESVASEVQLGIMDIPIRKIKGTKTIGRASSFAPNFMPLLLRKTEFGTKWIHLCEAHLNEGIRDAIKVYEYMNWFYVEEGNKRVSVLKYYDAVFITAEVTRIIPKYDPEDESIVIYYEFLEFYKKTKVNYIWMSERDGFNQLYTWFIRNQWIDDLKEFEFTYYQFRKVYHELGGNSINITTGDALVKYLEIYPEIRFKTTEDIQKELKNIWTELELMAKKEQITLEVDSDSTEKRSFLDGITNFTATKKGLRIAFIHSKSSEKSMWTYGHEIGRAHLEDVFKDQLKIRVYNDVPEDERAYDVIHEAAEAGNDVIFTTSPTFFNQTVKAAVEYRHIKFLNCSENFSSKNVRTYFGRFYEPNFLVGMIAGGMTATNNLGYVVTYPIPEVISSINAFTLGARFVNPYATVQVKWVTNYKEDFSEESYDIGRQLMDMGVDIISHQESSKSMSKMNNSGIYFVDKTTTREERNYLATPMWNWGEFYEKIIRNILNGSYHRLSTAMGASDKAINYWWGMDTEVVDIFYSQSNIPYSMCESVEFMKNMIMQGEYHPFRGPLIDQKGMEKLGAGCALNPREILTMNWFVDGVLGSIPSINVLEKNHPLLDLMGVKKRY